MARAYFVFLHRWVGLAMAGFLVIAGVTGTLLVWQEDLDAAINPHLFRVSAPTSGAPMLDMISLRDMAERKTGEAIRYFSLKPPEPGRAAVYFLSDKKTPEQIFVDPYTGHILGRRVWGDLGEGIVNLIPFLYRLHESLALGTTGETIFGVVALLWTLDCFVGAYLTFPAARGGRWWRRWAKAWKLRMNGGPYKLNFDLHRMGGLWVWAMLLVLAWSSVSFNLRGVYDPVMKSLFAHQNFARSPALAAPLVAPPLGWREARERGRMLMAESAAQKGFSIHWEGTLSYDPQMGHYFYVVRSSRDVSDRWPRTWLVFSGVDGTLHVLHLPTGEAAGDTVTSWIVALHLASMWGIPFRLFMTGMGLVVAMLAVTGVVIWWKKFQARATRRVASRRTALLHEFCRCRSKAD